jgi:hypothetical protein
MQLMQLGSIDKGSKSMELKYKFLSVRWFGCKAKKTVNNDDSSPERIAAAVITFRETL